MEYRRMNRKTGIPVVTHTPYSITTGSQVKKKRILTAEMIERNPLWYRGLNVGDEL